MTEVQALAAYQCTILAAAANFYAADTTRPFLLTCASTVTVVASAARTCRRCNNARGASKLFWTVQGRQRLCERRWSKRSPGLCAHCLPSNSAFVDLHEICACSDKLKLAGGRWRNSISAFAGDQPVHYRQTACMPNICVRSTATSITKHADLTIVSVAASAYWTQHGCCQLQNEHVGPERVCQRAELIATQLHAQTLCCDTD